MYSNPVLLKQLVYSSVATKEFSKDDLQKLLVKSRSNNKRDDISGLLLFRHACFIQVLEGPPNKVDSCYQRIKNDQNHAQVLILYQTELNSRAFGSWTMAFNDNESETIEGFSDFLYPYHSQHEMVIPEGSVKQLLKRFKEINKR
jgi:hypothetical protein